MNIKQKLLSDSGELRRLYLEERQTSREIAVIYRCSKHPIINALKELGITRHTRTRGMKPTCRQLRQWIEGEYLSLTAIAEKTGAHCTGIRWWAKKCGIPWSGGAWTQRNKRRGVQKPSKEQLEEWYLIERMSLENIAQKLGASRQYVTDRFEEYDMGPRASGWSHKIFECTDGHIVKSTYELRVDNWLSEHDITHVYEYQLCNLGFTGSADFMASDIFIEVWGVRDSPRYNARKKLKTNWYTENGHALISINWWDFSSQKKGLWKRKLETLL